MEIRTEESPDIKEHSFHRRIDERILSLGPDLEEIKDKYHRIVGRVLNRLKAQKVIFFSSSITVENLAHWPVLQVCVLSVIKALLDKLKWTVLTKLSILFLEPRAIPSESSG